ncbi:MAG: glycosyltransferase [Gammaproteobacteria bacterium]|nr:MAG: glycosyltransferase [Gammaproteobacteria bacterium]
MKLSILIKAFNEEALIGNCLDIAVAEIQKIGGEVILVDSLSTDRTVEIAKHYPVRIIQFSHKADCGCASAVQLGYQYAQGEYIYVLDGDMVLQAGFLSMALNYLESNPNVAGVAGKLLDTNISTLADKRRASEAEALQQIKEVSELGGGGLYRRRAIESVGYLAHRWFPACEEAELGVRLRAKGWRLIRLPEVAVSHTGHSESTPQMFLRLWRGRRFHAYGMYLRTAFGHPWWWLSMCQVWQVFAAPVFHFVAVVLALGLAYTETMAILPALIVAELLVWSGAIAIQAVRKGSISDGILSVCGWNFLALGAILGAIHSISDPTVSIEAKELTNHHISS